MAQGPFGLTYYWQAPIVRLRCTKAIEASQGHGKKDEDCVEVHMGNCVLQKVYRFLNFIAFSRKVIAADVVTQTTVDFTSIANR
mmetsp:Transcript_62916/g.104694  ORF Transcript_62916/g.104694 Transcript_62916/m.104694 type:complete len:84 (-) Transcript_62916:104-355(-)